MRVKRSRLYSTIGRYAKKALPYVATYAANRIADSYSGTVTKTKRASYGHGNVTAQTDSRTVYKRKSRSRKRSRPWKRFKNKVNYVINKQLAPCALVRNTILSRDGSSVNTQLLGVASIYSAFGNGSDLSDDQSRILSDTANRALGDATLYYRACAKVTSAVLDVTFENRADDAGAEPALTDMEVDVYELQCIRDVYVDAGQASRDIYDFIINCTNTQPRPTVGDTAAGAAIGSALTSDTIGWTPFQSSKFCRYFKINKKTKKYMTPGGFFTYQIRVPGDRTIKGTQFDVALDGGNTSADVQPIFNRHSKLLLFICKGEPLRNSVGTSYWSQPRFTLGVAKTFNYRIMDKAASSSYLL